MKKISLLILFILAVLPFNLSADCTLDNTDDLNGFTPDPSGTIFGQSFLACETGRINSILLNIQTGGTIDLFLTSGDGQLINLQQPHQTFSNVDVAGNKMVTFTFEEPFVVAEGQLYSIGVRGTIVNYDRSPTITIDPTADDGQSSFIIAMDGTYTSRANSDLYFRISSIPPLPISAPIPSMSQWGLLIFGLLVLNLGVGLVYRASVVGSIK